MSTLVEGKSSHHCTNPAPPPPNKEYKIKDLSLLSMIVESGTFFLNNSLHSTSIFVLCIKQTWKMDEICITKYKILGKVRYTK